MGISATMVRLGCLLALSSALGACVNSEAPFDAGDARASGDVHPNGDAAADAGENDDASDAGSDTADDAANGDAADSASDDAGADAGATADASDAAVDLEAGADSRDAGGAPDTKADANDAAVDPGAAGDTSDAGGEAGGDAGNSDGAGDESSDAPPPGVSIATYTLGVDNKGTVFNVADDYFDDRFTPATPISNFGLQSQIITVPNDDGSLDVAWLDYANGKGAPSALPAPGGINITHIDATLAASTTTATGISSYKLLGFAKDPSGNFYLGYNKDHPFKTGTAGDQNRINGNELHVAKLSGIASVWDKIIFGDQDNNNDATLGDPGGAATGILGYDTTNNRVVLYLGHSMMWFGADGMHIRHQAGFFRLLTPDSGSIVPPAGNDVVHFGSGWFYSHSFNQRLIIDGGNYYVLAHGDAYPRQLGFAKWSPSGYTSRNSTDFDESYWTVTGNVGDNKTDAQTGQFVRMSDGRFLIVHTSSQGRSARDVRLVFSDGATGKAADSTAVWLTINQGTIQATMPKVERLGNDVLVTYALWDSTVKHQLTWYAAVLDQALNVVVTPSTIANVEFVDSAPLFRFKGGPNAGGAAWVSGNGSHTLSVHVVSRSP